MKTDTLVFVALTTVLLYTGYVIGSGNPVRMRRTSKYAEICSDDFCVTPEKCEQQRNKSNLRTYCFKFDQVCCDVVKPEYRTHCSHHGGECMDKCGPFLKYYKAHCFDNQACCVEI